ncbi:MAG: AAA family ATPase [Sulfolobales archaeon]
MQYQFTRSYGVEVMSELIDRLKTFLEVLKDPFVGRDEEAKVIVLTLLAKEHCTFIGEPGCVVGNTLISSSDGRLYHIDDVAGGLPTGIYPSDFPIFPPAKASELHIYEVTDLVEVTTKLGFSLKVTPNHPIMTDRGWVEARNMRPGDRVIIFSKIPSPKELLRIPIRKAIPEDGASHYLQDLKFLTIDEALGELLGIIFARGYFRNNCIELKLRVGEEYLTNHIVGLARKVFGTNATDLISRSTRKSEYGVNEVLRFEGSLSYLIKSLIYDSMVKGRLPQPILESPKKVSAAFLRGLFEVCGELHNELVGTSQSSYIALRGLNVDLLREIQILLLRHGIISRVRMVELSSRYGLPDVEGVLEIYGFENLKKFYDEVGFISKKKNDEVRTLIKLLYDGVREDYEGKLLLDLVEDVRITHGLFKVYDFHIPTTHAFLTNGLLSHNTAKSALVRRAADLLDAKFFKYLLTRFTEPAEIFGPLDIRALHEGKYVRITYGKLPEADIAFLDEIFKANSAILNSLNTILQERILYDGYNEIKVPLWSLFGASNEVPEEPETEAFYDRFAIRHFVKPVSEDLWYDLLGKSWDLEVKSNLKNGLGRDYKVMSINHLRELHQMVLNVDINTVKSKFVKLLAVLEGRGIHVTDRRKGKALKIIAAHALLNGRTSATEDDLIVIKYVVPRDQEELDKVNTILSEELKTPYKYLRELNEVKANVKEILNYVSSLRNVESRFVEMRFREIYRDLEITKERVISLMIESNNKEVEKVANEVIGLIDTAMEIIRSRIA